MIGSVGAVIKPTLKSGAKNSQQRTDLGTQYTRFMARQRTSFQEGWKELDGQEKKACISQRQNF